MVRRLTGLAVDSGALCCRLGNGFLREPSVPAPRRKTSCSCLVQSFHLNLTLRVIWVGGEAPMDLGRPVNVSLGCSPQQGNSGVLDPKSKLTKRKGSQGVKQSAEVFWKDQ